MEAAISLKSDMVRLHLRIFLNCLGIFLKNLQNTTNNALLLFHICDHSIQCVPAQHSGSVSVCGCVWLRVSMLQCGILGVLQFVAVCCSVLHCFTVRYSVWQYVPARHFECVAVCCSVLQPRTQKGFDESEQTLCRDWQPGTQKRLDEFEEILCHDSFTCRIRNIAVSLLFEIPQNKRNQKGLDQFDGQPERACNVTHE